MSNAINPMEKPLFVGLTQNIGLLFGFKIERFRAVTEPLLGKF